MNTMWAFAPSRASIPTPETDDAALLRRFAERHDREAVGKLFSRHADAVYRVAWRYAGNETDAEDIVQTAFLQILRKPDQFRGESSVRAWIMGIVVNVSRMKFRGESRRREREGRAAVDQEAVRQPEAISTHPGALDNRELQQALLRAVETLPERYRLPVWLHYLEGFVFKDVATILDVPEKTVRSQIRRALIRLRRSPSVAGYSLSVLGIAAALSSIPCQAAPAALKASLPALVSLALPAATGTALSAKLATGLSTSVQLLQNILTTKLSIGVGTAALVTGGLVWLIAHGPINGRTQASTVSASLPTDTIEAKAPSDGRPPTSAIPWLRRIPDMGPSHEIHAQDASSMQTGGNATGEESALHAPTPSPGEVTHLPRRDRSAIRQTPADRCPADYQEMYEQYLINISDGASNTPPPLPEQTVAPPKD
jgi:RNA polymerase sigma-70 factor (ECF subfamily)